MKERFGVGRCCCDVSVPCIFAEDDFDRGDNTDLGSDWTEVSGDLSIASNVLSGTGMAIHNTTKAINKNEGVVRGIGVLPSTSSRVRFVFNYTDTDNYDYVELYRSTTNVYLKFVTRSGGSDTTRHTANISYAAGAGDQWETCVEFRNTTDFVTASSWNGTAVISKRYDGFSTLNSNTGKAGVYLSNSATCDDWSFGKTNHEDATCSSCQACIVGAATDDFSSGSVISATDSGFWEIAENAGGTIAGGVLEMRPPDYQLDGVRRCWRGTDAEGDELLFQFEITDITNATTGASGTYGSYPWIGAYCLDGQSNSPCIWAVGNLSGGVWTFTWRCELGLPTFNPLVGTSIGTYASGDIAKIVITNGASRYCTVKFYINGTLKSTKYDTYATFDADRRFAWRGYACDADLDDFAFQHTEA